MKELFTALHKFQGMVGSVKRDAVNPHFKNRYATLEAVCDTIRPSMQECGLVWMQAPCGLTEFGVEIKTVIAHAASGETFESVVTMPLTKRDAQGVGSALTYGMRYSLMAALGLPPSDDDDANQAVTQQDPTRSSASLKKENAWEPIQKQIENELLDVHSIVALGKLRNDWRNEPQIKDWPAAWKSQVKELFDRKENELNQEQA